MLHRRIQIVALLGCVCALLGCVCALSRSNPMEDQIRDKRNSEYPCGVPVIRPRSAHTRIVGGRTSNPHSYPWVVSFVLKENWKHICGGSIISSQYIVTAAHCLQNLDKDRVEVIVGSHSRTIVEENERAIAIAEILNHEEFHWDIENNNDIAVVRLQQHLAFNDHVIPICVPARGEHIVGTCVAAGWGRLETYVDVLSEELMEVSLPLMEDRECRKLRWYSDKVNGNMICAGYERGGRDSCKGDSGGPLMCRVDGVYTLYGITSFGNGCAEANKPGIYARVERYSDWLCQQTAGDFTLLS